MAELLWGFDHWENLYLDLDSAVEVYIDGLTTDKAHEVTFLAHSVHEAISHLPDADWLLSELRERTCEWGEVDEGFTEQISRILESPEVTAAAQALLDLIASKITYRMADKVIFVATVSLWPKDPEARTWDWKILASAGVEVDFRAADSPVPGL